MPDENNSRTAPATHSAPPGRSAKITLIIASTRPALVDALLAQLRESPEIEVVGAPVTIPSTLRSRLSERSPTLLLLDEEFFDRIGPVDELLHNQFPRLSVLLVCDEVRQDVVERIVEQHFRGFVLTSEYRVWNRAIRRVVQGELWLPRPLLADAVYRHLQVEGHDDRSRDPNEQTSRLGRLLTGREVEVVRALRGGLANKEIAEDLGIAEDTVKKHLRNVYRKLGIRRRSQLLLTHFGGRARPA